MPGDTYIYALLDCSNRTRYIGKTINLKRRLRGHKHERDWICYYLILEVCNDDNWSAQECFWIAHYGLENLENKSKGGKCWTTPTTLSEETKLKISKSCKGRIFSEDHKKKIGLKVSGLNNGMFGHIMTASHKSALLKAISKPRSEETKRKIRESNLGQKRSPETRQRLSEAHKGKIISIETRRKMSDAHKGDKNSFFGRHHSDQTKQLISNKNKGNKYSVGRFHSAETRQKISNTKLAAKQIG